ncbi:hypothetical protein CEXT_48111 [Caerostris extrusa]|uniref:Uncharacterized protein n=1 Tax=Caerostris extrusa TaxID=172846 RepID=A0AAV4V868_CAEEX|nr:hypothetical protein CEXT_48111 [Caerostris extrusa]
MPLKPQIVEIVPIRDGSSDWTGEEEETQSVTIHCSLTKILSCNESQQIHFKQESPIMSLHDNEALDPLHRPTEGLYQRLARPPTGGPRWVPLMVEDY